MLFKTYHFPKSGSMQDTRRTLLPLFLKVPKRLLLHLRRLRIVQARMHLLFRLAPKLRDSGVSQTIGTSICDPPPTAPSGPSISSFAGYSLQDAIVAASNSNAYTAGPQTSYGFSDIFGNRYRTLEELNRTKATTLGVPKAVGHTFTQQNFHGLWWGAKRIWTGDLLRLKIAAMQLQETVHVTS
ncbi:hypothetical protein C8J55DRAFT_290548 [Lentinula edodes]|uniref:Uncharacterized protein n=1 Tax=Lentinula lateritia TaxID=40482 RepID=A0A9W9DCX8_9AGAR|nr:hypothetical protein C8J55DRAFT_290548 [Lentinula edodes]